jgi:hypothetical protein
VTTDRRALPRSLDPLAGESLPGYLLRLAHRLALTPARLAMRTGLAATGRFGTQPPDYALIGLPTAARDAFAHTARLSTSEVDDLCLQPLDVRYPLVASTIKTHPGRPHATRWVLIPHTRYCPQCLASTITPVQREHGGAWRRVWHLPMVFACIDHHRLLEHGCPDCRQPVHGTPRATMLLPNMRVAGLHPAQCRATISPGSGLRTPTCCGARLDTPTGGDTDPGDTVIELQRQILTLLDPCGPDTVLSAGRVTTPRRYFTDLRTITALICFSWPALRQLSPTAPIALAIDHHVARQHREDPDAHHQTPARRRNLDIAPRDAAASAGLTAIASQILAGDSPEEVRERLRPLLPASTRQAHRSSWGLLADRTRSEQSDGLRQAYQPLLRTFAFTRDGPHTRRAPQRQTHFGPEHIPAFLPNTWYTRHFHQVHGVNPRLVRRTAAVRLVQLITGGSLGEAAEYLGINPTGKQYVSAEHVHRWARQQPDPQAFDAAIHALADDLDTAPDLVNYQRRRTTLADWALESDEWRSIAARLPSTPGPNQPNLGDLKRQCASQVVWVHVTQGEHLFAPRPIEALQPPDIQRLWQERRNTIWHQLQTNRPLRHYADLRRLLTEYADRLARHIDTTS